MLLVLLAIACVLSVPLRGGRLRRLADIRLRGQWAALVALVAQVLVLGVFAGGDAWWHAIVHVATTFHVFVSTTSIAFWSSRLM